MARNLVLSVNSACCLAVAVDMALERVAKDRRKLRRGGPEYLQLVAFERELRAVAEFLPALSRVDLIGTPQGSA